MYGRPLCKVFLQRIGGFIHPEVTIPVMTRWMDKAAHMLENVNAHPRGRQLTDAARHDAPLSDWLDRFLRDWLKIPA